MNIEKEVLSWQRETFPNATDKADEFKLCDEICEFAEELEKAYDFTSPEAQEEFADICIVYIQLLHRKGTSLQEIIANKMVKNKMRVWGDEDENGDRPRVR